MTMRGSGNGQAGRVTRVTFTVCEFTCDRCELVFRDQLVTMGIDSQTKWLGLNPATGHRRVAGIYDNPILEGLLVFLMLDRLSRVLTEGRLQSVAWHLFEVTCDVDDDGGQFRGEALPRCPGCGSYGVWWWTSVEPLEFVTRDIPDATHDSWSRLDRETQLAMLRSATSDFLSR